jgi:hypothetical protein
MHFAHTVLALAMCVPGAPSTSQLSDELRSLKLEVYAEFVEDQRVRVAALEAAVEDARREIAQIDNSLHLHAEELQSWMKELYESELSAQERAQAHSIKEQAVAATERQIRSNKAAALGREGQLIQRLTRERDRLRRLENVVNGR